MNRTAMYRQAMRIVILLLVGLLAAPLTVAEDYADLSAASHVRGAAPALAAFSAFSTEVAEDDGSDPDEVLCSCSLCVAALGGMFPVVAPSLPPGEMAVSPFPSFFSSSYRTEVYRPPIG